MGAFKGKFSSVEEANCLDVNNLVKQIKISVLRSYPEMGADDVRLEVGKNLELFKVDGQSFKFTSIPNKLGGKRWMVFCPHCDKRVIKLYKPTEDTPKEQSYFCKECHNLKPPSALYGPTRRYKEVVKPVRRMEQIKKTLKNKNLSDEKTKEYLDEYDKLKAQVQGSTFYRKMSILSDNPL